MAFFPPLHVRQGFLQQADEPKEVGVHDSPHLINGLTLDRSNQTHASVTYCERKSRHVRLVYIACIVVSIVTVDESLKAIGIQLTKRCLHTEDVHPALREAVHTGFDGVLITYIQLFDLQGPAQGPTCCLNQCTTLTQVPHGGIDCRKENQN